MNVHGAPGHRIEQRLWDPVAVRRPDEQLRTEREQRRDRFRIEPLGLEHREPHLPGAPFDDGFADDPTRRRAVGLRDDTHDLDRPLLTQALERLERGHGELGSAEEQRALC